MSFDAHLIHTATIQRGNAALDSYGNATYTWEDLVDTFCRLVEKTERVWISERAESAVVTRYVLLVPATTDVAERDRVVVDGVTYEVEHMLRRNARALYHKSLQLSKVS